MADAFCNLCVELYKDKKMRKVRILSSSFFDGVHKVIFCCDRYWDGEIPFCL